MCLLVCTVCRGNSHILPHWVLKNKSVRWAKTGIISLTLNKLTLRLIEGHASFSFSQDEVLLPVFPLGTLKERQRVGKQLPSHC